MKKILFFMCVTVVTPLAQLHAQISTLIAEKYDVGLVVKAAETDYTSPGQDGANRTWDFSTLSFNDSVKLLFFGNVSGSPFPDADVVRVETNGRQVFYQHTSAGVYELGTIETTSDTITSSNSKMIMQLPFTYTNTFMDSFQVSGGLAGSASGLITGVGDAFGQLILPNATYPNTIRVKIVDSMSGSVSGSPVTIIATRHAWFDDTHASPLLLLDSTSITTIAGTTSNKQAFYLRSESLNIGNAPVKELKISGAITGNRIIINDLPDNDHSYAAQLYDVSGKLLLNQTFQADKSHTLHTNTELVSGLYLLLLEDQNQQRTIGTIKLLKH